MNRPHTKSMTHRYLLIGILFSVICLIFIITLAVVQFKGRNNYVADDGSVIRSITVVGLRGEIYDRNGKLLVGNATSYDLIYEYGAMPDTRREVNKSLLSILEALTVTGNGDKLNDDLFALEGSYPNYRFSDLLADHDSAAYKAYVRIVESHPDYKLKVGKTTPKELASYFVKRYKLSDELYSEQEISSLIRLYYEMERVNFGQYQSYTIAKGINEKMITYIEESRIEGANFTVSSQRVYHYPGIASHILGRLGKITAETFDYYNDRGYPMDALVGTSGCEQVFEDQLHGQNGKKILKYDKNGTLIEEYYEILPISGNDIYLTIDIDLQIAAEEGLAENVAAVESATAGAVTVLDPNSGAVLAMASYPTYDLTRFDSIEYYQSLLDNAASPLLNRATQGVYAPGSTYKLGVAIAALSEGYITPTTTHTCTSVYPYLHKPTCLANHGTISVTTAIRDSCNIFFYYVGNDMGTERITDYTVRLGLGIPTGIELAERLGVIAGPLYRESNHLTPWSAGDNLSAAIGQSDHGYTPLQLSVYTASVINGGKRYSAHLLDSVHRFYTGELVSAYTPTVMEQVNFSDDTYNIIIRAMEQVITNSSTLTGRFSSLPVRVGGKTGTAQVDGKRDYSVFTAFAPLESPELVASCIIEEGVYGQNAAITVSRIFEAYFNKKDVTSTEE